VIPAYSRTLLLSALLPLAVGCASVTTAPLPPASGPDAGGAAVPDDPRERLQYHVLVGELAGQRNALDVAAFHYLEAAQLSQAPELAESATRYALLAGDEDKALLAALRWSTLAPEAVPPRELIARNHLRKGKTEALYTEARAIIARHPEGHDEGFREVALLLSSDPQQAEPALAVMQRLVNEDAGRAAAHYAYGLQAIRLGRFDLGIEQADAALRLERDWTEAYLLKMGAQVRAGKLPDARKTFDHAHKQSSETTTLRLAYARLLLEAEQAEAAREQYREVLRHDRINADAHFALALLDLQARKADEAYGHLLTLFESGQRRDDAAWFLGQIEDERENYREAYRWYGAVTGGSHVVDALLRKSFMVYKLEGMAPALAALQSLRQHGGGLLGPQLYVAEAELYFEDGQPAQALQRYEAGLKEYPEDLNLIYGRAMAHAELDDFPSAERDLRFILARLPDDARSLNALGYLLSNHTNRYQEAFVLIERALAITPEDPAVMDSMGWIQYRLGNLEGALVLLQEAFKRQPDPEIAAHLGEVLWQLGQRDKANAVWRTALAESPDHRVLRETVDRLSQ
jgi:tetratricopeptide (TPR) repeat protein